MTNATDGLVMGYSDNAWGGLAAIGNCLGDLCICGGIPAFTFLDSLHPVYVLAAASNDRQI
uniref:Uncharacterized protein n=1 Tax=Leersia perrieri TaxID=77586 RepID=A0A0D9VNY2_9ORYZ